MQPIEEIRKIRIQKLEKLKAKNINPFPAETGKILEFQEIKSQFKKLSAAKKKVSLAGRITAQREHGGAAFIDLYDDGGYFQVYLRRDKIGEKSFDLFKESADIGDFIFANGRLFTTKAGEETLEVKEWKILAKSLRPLPEKWHGLQDIEERFRKRYLDILFNKETRARFEIRHKLIALIRDFLNKESFLEVETPLLHPQAGGALAKPFITHHNALDCDFFLRIAPELYLKRLLIAGYPKIYEIGRNFRNEGIDQTHNPEFTMLELYEAYADSKTHLKFLEKFFRYLVKSIFGKLIFAYHEKTIDLKNRFKIMTFSEVLNNYALISDFEKIAMGELLLKAKRLGLDIKQETNRGKIADEIFRKICRPKMIDPVFIVNHPQEISPLAKPLENNPGKADRYQLIIAGLEIVNGFSELNNPLLQKEFFENQQKLKEAGEEEIQPMDKDFLEAMEYGMPPAAGLGIGIDRLTMLFTDTDNIKEVILFPTLKPII